MADLSKRSSGLKQNLRNAFSFLVASVFLVGITAQGFAAAKARSFSSKTTEASGSKIGPTEASEKNIPVAQIGPAGEAPPLDIGRIYDLVPGSKSLRTSSRFKVIDDFSGKGLKNQLGGAWGVDQEKTKALVLEIKREDARGVKSGSSLWLRYNLKAKGQAEARTSLEKLDMSAAQYLAVKCQVPAETSFKGRLRVALSDWAGKTVAQDMTEACRESTGWNDAILPLSVFRGVDLDQLRSLAFIVLAKDKNMAGKIGLDEVAFFGPPEVGFESVVDNMKGFPQAVFDEPRRKELLATGNDKDLLMKIARDTWKYFENAADKKSHLVVDHYKIGDFPLAAAYTSPTNIAMDLLATVGARELGILNAAQAETRAKDILAVLKKLKAWKGFFFNFYETTRLAETRRFVSSVDSAWLAVALVVTRQAFPGDIAKDATAILDGFHFQEFLDPDTNQLRVGYDVEEDRPTPYHYGMLVTEARIASLYGIGKGDLSQDHWWYLYRTAPDAWDWQTQKPEGKMVEREGVSYFQGYYKEGGKKFVPSWGGSLFEFLMPTLVINEKKYAPKSLGENDKIVAELHRDFALKDKKYPVWGISPASTADGRRWRYEEYGVKRLGAKGYPDRGVITPHVTFLALDAIPKDAIKNIRKLLTFPIYGEYGFYDSITFPSQRVNTQYLALDQGMIFVPIVNYLKKGVIQDYFHKDPVGKKIEKLLDQEKFF